MSPSHKDSAKVLLDIDRPSIDPVTEEVTQVLLCAPALWTAIHSFVKQSLS